MCRRTSTSPTFPSGFHCCIGVGCAAPCDVDLLEDNYLERGCQGIGFGATIKGSGEDSRHSQSDVHGEEGPRNVRGVPAVTHQAHCVDSNLEAARESPKETSLVNDTKSASDMFPVDNGFVLFKIVEEDGSEETSEHLERELGKSMPLVSRGAMPKEVA